MTIPHNNLIAIETILVNDKKVNPTLHRHPKQDENKTLTNENFNLKEKRVKYKIIKFIITQSKIASSI